MQKQAKKPTLQDFFPFSKKSIKSKKAVDKVSGKH